MFIYNVTVNVEKEIHDEWFDWMKNTHVHNVMKTGVFKDYKMLRLLNEEENNTGITYAVQYYCNTLDEMEFYLQNYAPALRKESERFEGKFVAFRTFLQEV